MEGVRRRRVRVRGGIHRGRGGCRGRGRPEAGGKRAQRRRRPNVSNNLEGGWGPVFMQEQDREIINMVLANNAIRLREIQTNIIGNHAIFNNVDQVSQSTLAHILKIRLK